MNVKNVFICFILVIITYYILVLYRDHHLFPKVLSICKEKQERLKVILPIIINKLDKYQIKHFIFSGTLLGYKRHHKKFIPWDDDIDLVLIKTSDIHKKIKQINYEIASEFKIIKSFFGYKFVDEKNDVFIDLFVFIEENNLIKTNDLTTSIIWPNDYFVADETYPLVKDVFEGVLVNVPKNPKKYLKRQYGNWKNIELTDSHYLNLADRIIIRCVKYNHLNGLNKTLSRINNNH
jgi:phosphorylcholine metabolism protein LicD